MLCLTRRPGQSIIITSKNGDTITIRCLRIDGNQVKVGIDAPAEYRIVRDELVGRKVCLGDDDVEVALSREESNQIYLEFSRKEEVNQITQAVSECVVNAILKGSAKRRNNDE